jgi:cell shape-determining protein MreC
VAEQDAVGITQKIKVRPDVDFEKLEEVVILIRPNNIIDDDLNEISVNDAAPVKNIPTNVSQDGVKKNL